MAKFCELVVILNCLILVMGYPQYVSKEIEEHPRTRSVREAHGPGGFGGHFGGFGGHLGGFGRGFGGFGGPGFRGPGFGGPGFGGPFGGGRIFFGGGIIAAPYWRRRWAPYYYW